MSLIRGIALIVILRIALNRLMLARLRHGAKALSERDYAPLLAGFADDAVLLFNDSNHRWAGVYGGKAGIQKFLQEFVHAGLRGEINQVFVDGWPWSMTVLVRFADAADASDGTPLYANQLHRPVRPDPVRENRAAGGLPLNVGRVETFDRRLTELGIEAIGR